MNNNTTLTDSQVQEMMNATRELEQIRTIFHVLKSENKEFMDCLPIMFSRYKEFGINPGSIASVALHYMEKYFELKKETVA